MLYDVSLRISYRYQRPVLAGRHLLHLMPLDLPGEQRAIAATLDVVPRASERSRFTDFFENNAVEIVFNEAHSKIDFLLKARIERLLDGPPLDMSLPMDQLETALERAQSLGPASPLHFLGRSPRIRPNGVLRDFAFDLLDVDVTVLEAVRTIGRALKDQMTFDAAATSVETRHEEAFEKRHGVCQDFSHIMIAALRSIGIPAGYVSGFLRTRPPEGQPRMSGADAMHAWVRAWCGPEMGWVEYDPTNAIDVAADHIVVARGRDYSDVSPVKGVLKSTAAQHSSQAVDVIPLEAATQ